MGKKTKKIIVDLDANTAAFDKKMQESLAKLKEFEGELLRLGSLLTGFGDSLTTFGNKTFDLAKNIHFDSSKAIDKFDKEFDKFLGEVEKLKIKGFYDLAARDAKIESVLFEYLSNVLSKGKPFLISNITQIKEEIGNELEEVGLYINTAASNLKARLDSIKIEFNPLKLNGAKTQEDLKAIDTFFKNIERTLYVRTNNFNAFANTDIRESIKKGLQNALDVGIPLNEALNKAKSAFATFWANYAFAFESSFLASKVDQKLKESISMGLPADEAIAKIGSDFKKSIDDWSPVFSSSFKFLADTIFLGFQSLTDVEDKLPDFGIAFRKLLAGFLSSLGDTLIQMATKMLLAQKAIQKAMLTLGSFTGWGAIAALFGIGLAFKGVSSLITKSVNKQLNPNGTAGDNGMLTTGQNMAPSYAMQKQSSQQTTNESVLRGGDIFWSSQRYEVIRGF